MASHTAVKQFDGDVVIPFVAKDYCSEADELACFFMPKFTDKLTQISILCYRMKKKDDINYVDYKLELIHIFDSIYSFFEIKTEKENSKFNVIGNNPNLSDIVEIRRQIPVFRHIIKKYNNITRSDFSAKDKFYESEICPQIKMLGECDYNFKQIFYKICKKEGKTIDDYLFKT